MIRPKADLLHDADLELRGGRSNSPYRLLGESTARHLEPFFGGRLIETPLRGCQEQSNGRTPPRWTSAARALKSNTSVDEGGSGNLLSIENCSVVV